MSGFLFAAMRLVATGGALLLTDICVQAQQFSAHLVKTVTPGGKDAAVGRLFVQGDKVRIETAEFPDGFFIINGSQGDAWFVRPAARVYMAARRSTWLTRAFVVVDPEHPCGRWQSAAILAGVADQAAPWRCEIMGNELVGGRETTLFRWQAGSPNEFLGWIDPKLNFPLRVRIGGAKAELAALEEGPQPDPFFEIPPSYRRFDPEDLIKRIKQSDVWVEAPAP